MGLKLRRGIQVPSGRLRRMGEGGLGVLGRVVEGLRLCLLHRKGIDCGLRLVALGHGDRCERGDVNLLSYLYVGMLCLCYSRVSVILPSDPVGDDKVGGCWDSQEQQILVVGVACQDVQELSPVSNECSAELHLRECGTKRKRVRNGLRRGKRREKGRPADGRWSW